MMRITQGWRTVLKRGPVKPERLNKYLGCSQEELGVKLEAQFDDKMSWDNIGEWYIDYRRPMSSFDLRYDEDCRMCFHYSNLRPRWGLEGTRPKEAFDWKTFPRVWDGVSWQPK